MDPFTQSLIVLLGVIAVLLVAAIGIFGGRGSHALPGDPQLHRRDWDNESEGNDRNPAQRTRGNSAGRGGYTVMRAVGPSSGIHVSEIPENDDLAIATTSLVGSPPFIDQTAPASWAPAVDPAPASAPQAAPAADPAPYCAPTVYSAPAADPPAYSAPSAPVYSAPDPTPCRPRTRGSNSATGGARPVEQGL